MKNKKAKKVLALVMVFILVAAFVPFEWNFALTPVKAETKNYSFEASSLTAAADKEVVEEGTVLGNVFKVVGSVTKRVSSGAVKSIEVNKAETASLDFTVEGLSSPRAVNKPKPIIHHIIITS